MAGFDQANLLRSPAIRIRVLAFASAADLLGQSEAMLEVAAPATVASLRSLLIGRNPAFERWGARLAIAVEGEVAGDGQALNEGNEVALLPPVSGG